MMSSLPVRGAWIEIIVPLFATRHRSTSLPVRGAWIEIVHIAATAHDGWQSLPVRGAWIEIDVLRINRSVDSHVAPRAGSVD